MKKYLTIILALALVVSMFAGCSAQEKTPQTQAPAVQEPAAVETKPVETEAPKELSGEVNVYMASSEDVALGLKESFEKAYPGITMNYVNLGGGEMLTRLRAEKDNPQADFMFGGAADIYMSASNEGLFMPYVPDFARDAFDDDCISPEETYIVGMKSILGIVYDKTWYDTNNVPYPETWDDLLIPELKNNVIVTNPGTSTTGYMLLSTLIALRGEEDGMQFMYDLDANIKSYAKGGSGPASSISLGEAAAGVSYLGYGIQLQDQGYTHIGICVPSEGTVADGVPSAVIANCANPENAKAFQDWYLSEGLKMFEEYGYYNIVMNKNIPTNEIAMPYWEQLKDANVDYLWATANYDRLVAEWDAKISNN